MAGAGFWPGLEGCAAFLREEDGAQVLELKREDKVAGRVYFDKDTKLALRYETGGKGILLAPIYKLVDGRLRLEERRVLSGKRGGDDGEAPRARNIYGYSAFRKVNDFVLPTRMSLKINKETMDLTVEFTRINEQEVVMETMDPAKVKLLVAEYTKRYSKWTTPEKLKALSGLAETGHEDAAYAIAKKGLHDSDLTVRLESVRTLGEMKCRNVVSLLNQGAFRQRAPRGTSTWPSSAPWGTSGTRRPCGFWPRILGINGAGPADMPRPRPRSMRSGRSAPGIRWTPL